MADTPTPPGQAEAPAPSPAPAPGPGPSAPVRARRWPRRVAIGVLVTGALLGTAYWYLGRESTLQSLALRVASASGGKITITGVSGSLYGAMHIGHLVFRTPESVLTGDNIDIDWSPWQYLSNGVAISKLHVASLTSQSLKESEPAKMPISLAPPFTLTIDDARIARLTLIGLPVAPIAGAPAGAPAAAPPATVIDDVRFKLHGDAKGWQLRNASAATPWGLARAEGSIGAVRPFKLDGTASLTQSQAKPGATPPQLALRFGGDLATTALAANGQSGKAVGEANLTLAPFDPVPLREMHIKGRNIDPGFFNPALPTADLSITVAAKIEASRAVSGSVNVVNDGPAGTIDHQRLPLRAMRGQLTGNLTALTISDVLLDFGVAGKFSGGGQLQRSAADSGIGAAQFTLHTDRLDLKNLHSRLKTTSIAGDIKLTNAGDTQTLDALLTDAGIRLGAHATMADNLLRVSQADISAGKSHIRLSGNASLTGAQAFKLKASAEHFDPASFGDYPAADINADINADGHVAPAWKVAADFALRPSCLFNQPLSGQGKLNADASHVSGIDAVLALGKNRAELRGSFGAPGERLTWRVDGGQLSAVRADLAGSVLASGVVTGTMAAPRTSFEVDAKGLALVPAARGAKPVAAADSVLHASGEAWLANKVVEVKATGVAQRFNPAAFGSPLAGSINGA
ncbi:MAG: hypothetical protein ABIT83_18100, partial [Massilia sp.]